MHSLLYFTLVSIIFVDGDNSLLCMQCRCTDLLISCERFPGAGSIFAYENSGDAILDIRKIPQSSKKSFFIHRIELMQKFSMILYPSWYIDDEEVEVAIPTTEVEFDNDGKQIISRGEGKHDRLKFDYILCYLIVSEQHGYLKDVSLTGLCLGTIAVGGVLGAVGVRFIRYRRRNRIATLPPLELHEL